MKIRMKHSGRIYRGTPLQIVEALRAAAVLAPTSDVDAYMREVVTRLGTTFVPLGATVEARCSSFLAYMIFRDPALELEGE